MDCCHACDEEVLPEGTTCDVCGAPRPPHGWTPGPRRGTVVGGHRLVEVIGEGGMGRVWLAEHVHLARVAVVKLIHARHALDEVAVERFLREARTQSCFGRSAAPELYDFGRTRDGTPYLVMERIEGETLDAMLERGGPCSAEVAIEIGEQVAEFLARMHDMDRVHRDVKPSNLMLAAGEGLTVRVLDFGIAKQLEEERALTVQGGQTPGTLRYMAPEAFAQQPLGPAADQFALGVVLYELLTGASPFAAESSDLVPYRICHHDPPPPSRITGVPEALDAVVMRMLAKDPAERYPDMRAARAALRAVGRGDSAGVQAVEGAPLATRTGRLRPSLGVLIAAAAGLTLFVVLALFVMAERGGDDPKTVDMGSTEPVGDVAPMDAGGVDAAVDVVPVVADAIVDSAVADAAKRKSGRGRAKEPRKPKVSVPADPRPRLEFPEPAIPPGDLADELERENERARKALERAREARRSSPSK